MMIISAIADPTAIPTMAGSPSARPEAELHPDSSTLKTTDSALGLCSYVLDSFAQDDALSVSRKKWMGKIRNSAFVGLASTTNW
jgi:hypothetical protein